MALFNINKKFLKIPWSKRAFSYYILLLLNSFLYTLIFAIIATLVYYFIIPKLIKLFEKIPYKVVSIICIILLVIFLADNIYSTKKPNIVRGAKIVNKT